MPKKVTASYLNEADWGLLADELASDYYHEHDGWESRWPVTLYVWCGDKIAASFKVERETSPHFYSFDRKDEIGGSQP